MSRFLDPVSQVSHKIKEEVTIRNTDDLQEHGWRSGPGTGQDSQTGPLSSLLTLSVIFTNRLKPSDDLIRRRPEML